MNKEEIARKVKELSLKEEWNHFYELPFGITTRAEEVNSVGNNTNKWNRLAPILKEIDLKNKTLLDVGCSDGFFSIEASKLGAKEVLGIDADPQRIEKATFVKDLLEIKNVNFDAVDIYSEEIACRRFDVTLALGILHRIPDFYNFLKIITELSNVIVLEFKTYNSKKSVCGWGGAEQKGNKYNRLFFIPSIEFVGSVLSSLGFGDIKVYKDKSKLKYKRTILVSSRLARGER